MKEKRLFLVFFSFLLISCSPKVKKEKKQFSDKELKILIFSNPKGQLEPCGCTSNPEGGIEKLPALFKQEKAQLKLFYGKLTKKEKGHKAKSDLALKILNDLKLTNIMDLKPGLQQIHPAVHIFIPGSKKTFSHPGGLVLGLNSTGVPSQPNPIVDIWLDPTIYELKQPSVSKILDQDFPISVGTKDRLQRAGIIKFKIQKNQKGLILRPQKLKLSAKDVEKKLALISKKESRIKASGQADSILGKKLLKKLVNQKIQLKSSSDNFDLSFYTVSVDKNIKGDPRIIAKKKKLFEILAAKNAHATIFPAEKCQKKEGENGFATISKCKMCHQSQYQFWQKTKHSLAFETLQKRNRHFDSECLGCHSVGMGEKGGFCNFKDSKPFVDVQCENCHGPALLHSQNPVAVKPPKTSEKTCLKCHVPGHSDQFNYQNYLKKIIGPGHGLKAP